MKDSNMTDSLASMRAGLQAIEAQLVQGRIPVKGLDDFKAAVDEIRLRVWSIMAASKSEEPQASLERFRLRRALEICQNVGGDLEAGRMSGRHRELSLVRSAASNLVGQIESAQAGAH